MYLKVASRPHALNPIKTRNPKPKANEAAASQVMWLARSSSKEAKAQGPGELKQKKALQYSGPSLYPIRPKSILAS